MDLNLCAKSNRTECIIPILSNTTIISFETCNYLKDTQSFDYVSKMGGFEICISYIAKSRNDPASCKEELKTEDSQAKCLTFYDHPEACNLINNIEQKDDCIFRTVTKDSRFDAHRKTFTANFCSGIINVNKRKECRLQGPWKPNFVDLLITLFVLSLLLFIYRKQTSTYLKIPILFSIIWFTILRVGLILYLIVYEAWNNLLQLSVFPFIILRIQDTFLQELRANLAYNWQFFIINDIIYLMLIFVPGLIASVIAWKYFNGNKKIVYIAMVILSVIMIIFNLMLIYLFALVNAG